MARGVGSNHETLHGGGGLDIFQSNTTGERDRVVPE